ncbi:hypothetical protein ARTHRO9AX_130020 [Arthrobacter sp. 9AX]|nr:hypothetical protein ARTHRO9AX_130020 [Arthrobacter sp. 9AX]
MTVEASVRTFTDELKVPSRRRVNSYTDIPGLMAPQIMGVLNEEPFCVQGKHLQRSLVSYSVIEHTF